MRNLLTNRTLKSTTRVNQDLFNNPDEQAIKDSRSGNPQPFFFVKAMVMVFIWLIQSQVYRSRIKCSTAMHDRGYDRGSHCGDKVNGLSDR